MAREQSRTSISEAAAAKWAAQAADRQLLCCKKIPGFHLLKLVKGCSWRYRYQDGTGRRRVATIGGYPALKPAEAAAKVADWVLGEADPLKERQIRQEKAAQDSASRGGKTLRKYLEGRYAALMEAWPSESVKITTSRLRDNFAGLMDRPMDEITRQDIRDWQSQCKGMAYTTIKRAYTDLKALLRRAVKDEVIAADPLDGYKLDPPSKKEQARIAADPGRDKRRMLTPSEITQLHNGLEAFAEEKRTERRSSRRHGKPHLPDLDAVAYPHWFIPFAHLAFHTGLRTGDLFTITWTELNIPFAQLRKATSKSLTIAMRKGSKPAVVEMKLNVRILEIMRAWWMQQGKPDSGLVFPSPKTGGELDRKAHNKPWKRVKALAGLPDNLNFYALRHHFISTLVAQGVPMLTVARLAGHKGVAMVEQHYGHMCPVQAGEAVDVLANQAGVRG